MKSMFREALTLLVLTVVSAFALSAQPKIFSKTGSARVEGRDVLVHVTVGVPPGVDAERAANAAIRAQGGIPLSQSEYSFTGLVWDQIVNGTDSVHQQYNPANDATGGDGATLLTQTQHIWSNSALTNSAFQMSFDPLDDLTRRCPSLVRECPGRQVFDGNNDVAWVPLNDPFTLAVTWSSSSTDEADVAMNTNQNWNTYDPLTVLLHEQGHVAGLGHSDGTAADTSDSIMVAIYDGVKTSLGADDIAGIAALYPLNVSSGICGDGNLDLGEECDGSAPTCTELGYQFGTTACTSCLIDDSGCSNNDPACTLGGIGDSCNLDSECCSGKCRGKAGSKTCR